MATKYSSDIFPQLKQLERLEEALVTVSIPCPRHKLQATRCTVQVPCNLQWFVYVMKSRHLIEPL